MRIRPISSEEQRNCNEVAASAHVDRGQWFNVIVILIINFYCIFVGLISVKNPKSNESEPPKDFFFDAVGINNIAIIRIVSMSIHCKCNIRFSTIKWHKNIYMMFVRTAWLIVVLMATMARFSPMAKQVLERHTQWKEGKTNVYFFK